MPTEVGIHDFAALDRRKAWVPTRVGMTGNGGRYVIHFTDWYNILRISGFCCGSL